MDSQIPETQFMAQVSVLRRSASFSATNRESRHILVSLWLFSLCQVSRERDWHLFPWLCCGEMVPKWGDISEWKSDILCKTTNTHTNRNKMMMTLQKLKVHACYSLSKNLKQSDPTFQTSPSLFNRKSCENLFSVSSPSNWTEPLQEMRTVDGLERTGWQSNDNTWWVVPGRDW